MNPTPGRNPRRAGFIILYALGTMVLVATLANVMVDSSVAEIETAKRHQYLNLARVAAESGIEYGLSVLNRELAGSIAGVGPWSSPGYDPPINWMKATDLMAAGEADVTVLEARPVTTTPLMWGGEGNIGAPRLTTQSQLVLWPSFTYRNVKLATSDSGVPTLFHLRARGEVIYDPNPADAIPGTLLGSAYVVQTFMVPGISLTCAQPFIRRLVWELEPDNLGPVPTNLH